MKRILILFLIAVFIAILICSARFPIKNIAYTELGIPTDMQYNEGIRARCPWDMIVWDEKLYVGNGDYGANAGPVDIWCYDKKEGVWENGGTTSEEEINRFCVVENSPVVPGIDPTEDWTHGNYYKLEGDTWTKYRNIPGGIHNFDMVEFQGKIFCGLGVLAGEYPVVCSSDHGETFVPLLMYKNGSPLDTSGSGRVRTYDLFVFDNSLYATFMYGDTDITYDLYRYENGSLVYDNTWYQKIYQIKFANSIISAKAEFDGRMFFTTGHLYATDDMANFTRVIFPHAETVYDICVYDQKLYALCGEKTADGRYTVSVWENRGGEVSDFRLLFDFKYDVPPLSFACHSGGFFIGLGDFHAVHPKNGMILSVDYKVIN